MKEKIQDKASIINVLGCLMLKPEILKDAKYNIVRGDFPERFHKIVFGTIENLAKNDAQYIEAMSFDTFLENYEVQYEVFNQNKGLDFINSISELAELKNFDYYYHRLKKHSLLNTLQENGIDVSEFYNPNLIIPQEQEKLQDKLDSMTTVDIVNEIDKKLASVKSQFKTGKKIEGIQAGSGMKQLNEQLKNSPERGRSLASGLVSTAVRGARKRKFYIRSLASGFGKTRLGVADLLHMTATKFYSIDEGAWLENPKPEAGLIITTELEFEEIQTMAIAFIAEVDEDEYLDGELTEEELKRVDMAIKIMEESPLYLEYLPSFDADEVEEVIKANVRDNDVQNVFFDYIHESAKLLSSMVRDAKVNLRTDQILLMLSDRLKTMCNELGVWLITSTQLNDNWKEEGQQDASAIRGSKAIIDKADVAMIGLPITKKDEEKLQPIYESGIHPVPNMVFNLFKMRRGRYKDVKIWVKVNLGTLRTKDCFITDSNYNPIPVQIMKTYIAIDEEELKRIEAEIEQERKDAEALAQEVA